jgi:hypothetical protein
MRLAKYYYLIATLPTLTSDSNQFMSSESFLELCRRWLSRRDLHLVESTVVSFAAPQVKQEKAVVNRILQHWQAFETQLRNALVRQRALKQKRDPAAFLRETEQFGAAVGGEWLVQGVRAAIQQENPLTAEQMLNNLRWHYLDELERGQFFTVEFLQVYYLKLQILERSAQFLFEQGEAHFQQAYAAAAKQLQGVAAIQL